MSDSKELPVHYRYDDYCYEHGLEIRTTKLYPSRETKCCYFVVHEFDRCLIDRGGEQLKRAEKRVLKNSVRRYCYPTKSEALRSFKARKSSQIKHAELSLSRAKLSLSKLEDVDGDFNSVLIQVNWNSELFSG